jgi:hypothetical protein
VKRTTVNHRVNVIRRAFNWAAKEELILASVYHSLQTVDGLRRGRTKAPESVPVRPVPDNIVAAVVKWSGTCLPRCKRWFNFTI